MVWGGVSFWRSLMRLDLIDVRLDLYPCVAGEGTRLFNDDAPKSYRLDLVSSTAFSNGIVGCSTPAPLAQRPAGTHGGCDGCARGCVIGGMA